MDISDENEGSFISFRDFVKKYYNKDVGQKIMLEEDVEENEERNEVRENAQRRFVIRNEDNSELSLPREKNYDNPFLSDEMTLTTDESDNNN